MTAAVDSATLDLYLEADRLEREWGERKKLLGVELMAEMIPGGEARNHDGSGVKLVRGVRRFNGELARKHLPPELFAAICVPAPDSKLAKELLAVDYPALMSLCQKTGEPHLRVL